MSNALRKYGIFLFIPGIVLGYSVLLKLAAGPYWLATNFDPAYQYLVNGVYLVKGLVPNHTDHPGTPLQMLICAICWIFNIGRSVEDVVTHVFMAPEFYLQTAFVVLSLFFFATSFGMAAYVFRKTGDTLAALLTQLPALSFLVLKSWEGGEPVLPVVANVSPEPLLMGVGNLFNICLLMSFFARTSRDEIIAALFGGFVGGLGVATKITFFPVLVVPLILLSWKNKVLFAAVFAASFFVWTLPILSKYPAMWGWISGLASHTGAYGAGKAGVIELHSYLMNWKDIIVGQGVFACLACAAMVLVFGKVCRLWIPAFAGMTFNKGWERGTSFLVAVLIGIGLQFSVVAKHPGAHYLLPGLGLFSVLIFLIYWQSGFKHALGRRITIAFIVISIISGAWQATGYRSQLADLTRDIFAFRSQVAAQYPNCTFIDYYRSSSPEAALFFGDGWNSSPHLGEELFRLYPNKYYFHIWSLRILSFNDRVWSNDLLAQNPCVLFRGDGGFNFSKGPYEVQLLKKGRFESIHLLTGTTEKQAALFLGGAVQFIQAGEYAKALMCALQARKFHYQPDSSVENLIKLFEPYLRH